MLWVTHQSVHIVALSAHEQHQAVDAAVKGLGAGKARQKLVAIDGQGVPVVVHHADEQLGPNSGLWSAVRDTVDRRLRLQHHLPVREILHPQVDTQARIGLLHIPPGLHAAGTYCQVVWRVAILQQVQVLQLGVRQKG